VTAPEERFLPSSSSGISPQWWALTRGDVDATITQVGAIIAQLLIPVLLLAPVGVSLSFSLSRCLPGFACGFLIGSLGLVYLGVALAKREGRTDVTAQAYGNNVPAIITYTLSIFLPVYLQSHDANRAWRIGAAAVVWTGIIKLCAAPFANAFRRYIPLPASMTVFGAAMYSYLALVVLQRIFDQPLVGIVALAIVGMTVFANVPVTSYRLPPFLFAWLIPLFLGVAVGYVHPVWQGASFVLPFVASSGPLQALALALPYLSVIAPMAIYHVLQAITTVEGASAAGDNYDARSVVAWDAVGTLLCGIAGSIITPVIYALHPPYKALGARIGFAFWTPLILLFVVMAGLTPFFAALFPWPILAALIAYVAVGVGRATLARIDRKYLSVVLLGFALPVGAVVSAVMNSALPALQLSAVSPDVQAALGRSIYWASVRGLGNGFLFLVLVVASIVTEAIDRNFGRAATWCLIASAFSWFGLMHSATLGWKAQPMYALGWFVAAAIVYSARWWRGDTEKSF
jgi:adenine/guanine/hypoxanthine permease